MCKSDKVALYPFILAMTIVCGEFALALEGTIPPKILDAMEPEIVKRGRPKIVRIRENDILNLRQNPELDADLVRFDFNVDGLTAGRRNAIEGWIRKGHNKIYLLNEDILKYATLFDQDAGRTVEKATQRVDLADHTVSTDCRRVLARGFSSGSGAEQYRVAYLTGLSPDEATILQTLRSRPDKVVAGSFPYGKSTVFFRNTLRGAYKHRWRLNFYHWALGYEVPGEYPHDSIIMENGDRLSGEILNSSFEIETSYADFKFDREKIGHVVFQGGGYNIDEMKLETGDNLSGVIQDQKVTMKLSSGGKTELDVHNIREIQWALGDELPEEYPAKNIISMENGDRLTGEVLNNSFEIRTSYADFTFDREKIDMLIFEGAGHNIDQMKLKTGDNLTGIIQDKKITIKLSSGGETELNTHNIREIRRKKPATEENEDVVHHALFVDEFAGITHNYVIEGGNTDNYSLTDEFPDIISYDDKEVTQLGPNWWNTLSARYDQHDGTGHLKVFASEVRLTYKLDNIAGYSVTMGASDAEKVKNPIERVETNDVMHEAGDIKVEDTGETYWPWKCSGEIHEDGQDQITFTFNDSDGNRLRIKSVTIYYEE